MNWLRRLCGRRPPLDPEQRQVLEQYHAQPAIAPSSPLAALRFVVADVETTGLDPHADRLISIGAVDVIGGKIRLDSAFETVFRQPSASSGANILIHGIDGTTQLAGQEPATATLQFIGHVRRSPLAGFHAGFDRVMIDRAARVAIGEAPSNIWLDLARLAPALFPGTGSMLDHSLDDWLEKFGIANHARHNALADALATAQLLQIVLAQAMAQGAATLADLMRIEQEQRWLAQLNR
ncbi:MAG: PolC-type DNA polymerase III [Burkholderiales bacterium]